MTISGKKTDWGGRLAKTATLPSDAGDGPVHSMLGLKTCRDC